ncbi:hypothetical protein EIN_267360 [Entamoeba invadens IP1]|uniref:Uncharacterized protein n=1 Tax=Entamoeba invadens IP1 TaxID=370355 RepID=A0A0A1UDZ8_ENTIV|nr:hypothetical protein EIN_267360 [Entamoeba invadens IP1]ELP91020.1 hypothetical protein EIN_267360 [Entamoeba invadens IP1]|eukprot:XP_004257791.1 hypothetical protein EIN_267360 [Entamoeba invadens IP1]
MNSCNNPWVLQWDDFPLNSQSVVPPNVPTHPFSTTTPKKLIATQTHVSDEVKRRRDLNTFAKQKGMSEECQRMAFLIGLLNANGVGFSIARRIKKAEKALQYIEVTELYGLVELSHGQLLDIVRREEETCKAGGASQSYNERHHRKNVFAVIYNYLIKLCSQIGQRVVFEMKKTKRSEMTVKMEKFISVTVEDKTYYSEDIIKIGNTIYQVISDLMSEPTHGIIYRGAFTNNIRIEPKTLQIAGEFLHTKIEPTSELSGMYWGLQEVLEYERENPEKCIREIGDEKVAFENAVVPSSLNFIRNSIRPDVRNIVKCVVVEPQIK